MPIFRARELRFMLGFAEARLYVGPQRFRGFAYPAMMADLAPALPHLEHCFYIGGSGSQSFERFFLETPRPDAPDALARAAAAPTT